MTTNDLDQNSNNLSNKFYNHVTLTMIGKQNLSTMSFTKSISQVQQSRHINDDRKQKHVFWKNNTSFIIAVLKRWPEKRLPVSLNLILFNVWTEYGRSVSSTHRKPVVIERTYSMLVVVKLFNKPKAYIFKEICAWLADFSEQLGEFVESQNNVSNQSL